MLKAAEAAVLLQNPEVMGKVWAPFRAVVMRAQDGDLGAFQCMVRMMQAFPEDGEVQSLVAWFAQIDSHDSRESGDSRESEIRVIQANRPDAL